MGRKTLAALALGACVTAAHAQTGSQAPGGAPPPQTPPTGSDKPAQPAPQRGFIAPILDIRIQGEGISMPKSPPEPQPEKPPAK